MIKETLIFGHKNPDTDSITSSLVMENLEKQLGNENAKAVRLGNVNKETQYVLKFLGIEAPELIEDVEDNQEVILVDHNESSQTVNNLSNAKILKVVSSFYSYSNTLPRWNITSFNTSVFNIM